MKGRFNVQFLVKTEPNRAKEKTKFHYIGIVTDKPILRDLAEEGTSVDFWTEDDLEISGNRLYECVLDLQQYGENQVIRFCSLVGEGSEIPF